MAWLGALSSSTLHATMTPKVPPTSKMDKEKKDEEVMDCTTHAKHNQPWVLRIIIFM